VGSRDYFFATVVYAQGLCSMIAIGDTVNTVSALPE